MVKVLKIFICEDIPIQLQQIRGYIEDYLALTEYDMGVVLAADSPNAILEYLKENKGTGLYFLDVGLMAEIDGIELAFIIRKHDPRGFIAFITIETSEVTRVLENRIEPLGYILKSKPWEIKKRVQECIDSAWEKYIALSELQPTFSFTEDGKTVAIDMREIMYFETIENTNKVTVYTQSGSHTFWRNLKDVEKILTSDFFRCHKSYLVNIYKVDAVDWIKRELTLRNGEKCPISIRSIPELRNALKNRVIIVTK